MGGKAITFGLVELYVPVPESARGGDPYESRDAIAKALRRWCERHRAERTQAVVDVLKEPALKHVDLLVFPGWTLPIGDERIPLEVLGAIGRRTVVLETFGPRTSQTGGKLSGEKFTRVLRGRRAQIAPAPQWIATAEDAEDGNRVGLVVEALREERRWKVRSGVRCALMICGEVNVVKHSQQGDRPLDDGLLRAVKGIDVVVNPAHTWTSLFAMACKRAWFTSDRVLLTTANSHGTVRVWNDVKGENRRQETSFTCPPAADVFVGGDPQDGRFGRENKAAKLGLRVIDVGPHKVTVVAHAAIQEKLRG